MVRFGRLPSMRPDAGAAAHEHHGEACVEKVDFALWSLAVSAIHGCGMCMKSHEKIVPHGGLSKEQIQAAVRIAPVVHATAGVLDGEIALAA